MSAGRRETLGCRTLDVRTRQQDKNTFNKRLKRRFLPNRRLSTWCLFLSLARASFGCWRYYRTAKERRPRRVRNSLFQDEDLCDGWRRFVVRVVKYLLLTTSSPVARLHLYEKLIIFCCDQRSRVCLYFPSYSHESLVRIVFYS